jgi:hypothetical protein
MSQTCSAISVVERTLPWCSNSKARSRNSLGVRSIGTPPRVTCRRRTCREHLHRRLVEPSQVPGDRIAVRSRLRLDRRAEQILWEHLLAKDARLSSQMTMPVRSTDQPFEAIEPNGSLLSVGRVHPPSRFLPPRSGWESGRGERAGEATGRTI